MKYFIIVLIVITVCQNYKLDPTKLFNDAKDQILSQEFISYRQTFHWPNMLDEIDTIVGFVKFQKNINSSIGYDFVTLGNKADMAFIEGELQVINHLDSTIITHSAGEERSRKNFIQSIYYISDSPINLLENSEHHLFVNPQSKLFERYEWRAYLNGEKSQLITAENDDFTMDAKPRNLEYILPANYVSVLPGTGKKRRPLDVTKKAPEIEAFDLAGNVIRLADFKGE